MGHLRDVGHFLDLRKTTCKVYVGFKSRNESKDRFLFVNSSNARTKLVWSWWGVNDEISLVKMV